MIEHLFLIPHYLVEIWPLLRPAVFTLSAMLALVLIARQFEKRWPIEPDLPRSDILSDWKVTGVNLALSWAVGPLAAISNTAIINAAGGGFIALRTDGWWFGASLLGFLLVADFYRYSKHRLFHAVPFFWALHSFHHSAEALTFVTGARHHWIDRVIEGACFPLLAILFRTPGELAIVAAFITFLPDGCAHMNVRLPLGRAKSWINNPQWHRIHHSTQPEHCNKNYASVLTLWDFVFGTAWIPRKDEYPATGLVPGEKCDILTSIVWPFRHYVHRLQLVWPVWLRGENIVAMRKVFARASGTPNA